MRVLVAFALVVPVLAAVPAAAQAPPAACETADPEYTSWADSRHGWQVRLDGHGRCGERLYATENGGRTWRLIHKSRLGPLRLILRTSRVAGVIFPARFARSRAKALWTRTNGRRWQRTAAIGPWGNESFAVEGRGRLLFWATRSALYRVAGWPSNAMRSRRVFRARAPQHLLQSTTRPWFLLENAPSGIAALVATGPEGDAYVQRGPDPKLALLLHRGQKNRLLRLPGIAAALARLRADAIAPGEAARVAVDWPRLMVSSFAINDHEGRAKPIGVGCVVWRSANAGSTWTVTGVRFEDVPAPCAGRSFD